MNTTIVGGIVFYHKINISCPNQIKMRYLNKTFYDDQGLCSLLLGTVFYITTRSNLYKSATISLHIGIQI